MNTFYKYLYVSIRNIKFLSWFFLILVYCNYNFASESDRIIEARKLFYQSVENSKTIKKTIKIFKEIEKNKEYEGLALTYIGALNALKGKFSFFPLSKYRHVIKGLKLMDQGIDKSPNDIEARFIRAMTCYYLPFFFKRKKTALNDFKVIITLLNSSYQRYDVQLITDVINFISENIDLNREEIEVLNKIKITIKKNED